MDRWDGSVTRTIHSLPPLLASYVKLSSRFRSLTSPERFHVQRLWRAALSAEPTNDAESLGPRFSGFVT